MWDKRDDSFPVGFGRPPRDTQFRKGESGNPKGRPRKALAPEDLSESELEKVFRKILNRKYNVADASGTRAVTGLEVLLQAQFQTAAKGSTPAQRMILQGAAELERRDEARRRAGEQERKDNFERMVRGKEIRRRMWDAAEKAGEEPEDPWPHPDDILINKAEQTYRIRGPLNASQEPYYDYLLTLRDQSYYMVSLVLRRKGPPDLKWVEIYQCCAAVYNSMLPLRWQIDKDAGSLSLAIEMHTMRELKALIAETERDALYYHRLAYPLGEKIRFDRSTRKALAPLIGRFGFRSIRQYEQHLEQESGNPPRPNLLGR